MVDEVPLVPAVRAGSLLGRVDYTDAFLLADVPVADRTAEQWARAMIEEAPEDMRSALRRGWVLLGLRLRPADDSASVLGWPVRDAAPDLAVLAAESWLGMRAELVFVRARDGLRFATLLQLRNPLARLVWAGTAARHRRVVRHLLAQAGRRAEAV